MPVPPVQYLLKIGRQFHHFDHQYLKEMCAIVIKKVYIKRTIIFNKNIKNI